MSKHTPGPWRLTDGNSDTYECRQIKSADGRSLMGDEQYYPWTPSDIEDWRLIAAAPELLEALKKAEAHLHALMAHIDTKPLRFQEYCWEKVLEARKAIAKAEGV